MRATNAEGGGCVLDVSATGAEERGSGSLGGRGRGQAARKGWLQCAAVIHKSALVKARALPACFAVLEMVLPVLVLLCMYIPSLLTKSRVATIPEVSSAPREIMDIRWTQSEGNYCAHLYSVGGSSVPTSIAYVGGTLVAEEVMHQALGYLLCETTTSEFPLKNLTAFSELIPEAFFSVLGLSRLNANAPFSYMDVVTACRNLVDLEERIAGMDSVDWPSLEEMAASSSHGQNAAEWEEALSSLDEILTHLDWNRNVDVVAAPTSACTEECLRSIECLRPKMDGFLLEFDDVADAIAHASSNPGSVAAIIEFPPEQELFGEYTYTIHVDASRIPDLNEKYTMWAVDSVGGMTKWKSYFSPANIQNAIDQAVVKIFTGGNYQFNVVPFYSSYPVQAHADPFKEWISGLIVPNILVFAFIPAAALQMQFIMYDRNLGLDKRTALAEMNQLLYSALLSAIAFAPYVVFAGIVSLMLSFLYPMASPSLMYAVLAFWCVSFCLFVALVSVFCSNSSILGSISVVVTYIVLWIPGLLVCNTLRLGSTWWLVVSIFPPSSLYVFGNVLSYSEQNEKGLTWASFHANVLGDPSKATVSASNLVGVMALSVFIHVSLVVLCKTGCIRRLWRKALVCRKPPDTRQFSLRHTQASESEGEEREENTYIEPASCRHIAAIEFQNISKRYGKSAAVRNFSMRVFQGQVTVLLGHNGAGKTTLLSILSGAISDYSGTLKLQEHCVDASNRGVLRKVLGICHQLDYLWPTLTVAEHVQVVQKLRGVGGRDVACQEILSMLKDLDMQDLLRVPVRRLSGGERRKLSLVLAFVGEPSIIMLDEPTAGMDTASRRTAWNFLSNQVDSRCIFLTTHLLDEADALGDRIAIMTKGKLLCCGSSMFLKRRYASGFRLLVSGKVAGKESSLARKIKTFIAGQGIPHLVSGKSIVFYLPEKRRREVALLLDALHLDSVAHRLSISRALLSDVFLISLQKTPEDWKSKRTKRRGPALSDDRGCRRSVFHTLLWKHRLNYFRSWHLIATSMVVPAFFALIAIVLVTILSSKTNSAGIQLSEDYIGAPVKPLSFFASGDPLKMEVVEEGFQGRVDGIALAPHDSWQAYILDNYPTVRASCGNPKDPTTCASVILNDSQLDFHATLSNEEKFFSTGSYTFATSNTALHGLPAALNVLNNVFLQPYMDGTGLDKVVTRLAPLGATPIIGWRTSSVIINFASVALLLAFCCCGASYGVNPAWERMHNCRIIQRLSSVSPARYWLAQVTFDLVLYGIFCAAVFVLVYMLPSRDFFLNLDAVLALFLVLALSGPGILHSSYILEALFKTDVLCFASLFALRSFVGIVFLEVGISMTVLESQGVARAARANDILRWLLPILPEYPVARTFYDLIESNFTGTKVDYVWGLQRESLLPNVLFAIFDSVIYSGIFWLVRGGLFKPSECSRNKAVSSAAVRPAQALSQKILRITGVHFSYKTSSSSSQREERGLRGLTFSVYSKGVLGFVGSCGSGKSTLLKVLAGVLVPTKGTVSRADVAAGECDRVSTSTPGLATGYCPQSGGLFPAMTVEEHMKFYADLFASSTDSKQTVKSANNFYVLLGLQRVASAPAHTLSEGNRRKLSVAIALSSNAPLAVLDEPSTGVDPEGQVRLCNAIRKASKVKSVVLSSHSVEEAESVCTRVGILDHGELVALNTLADLKASYANALKLGVRIGTKFSESALESCLRPFESKSFQGRKGDWLFYQVHEPQDGGKTNLGSIFSAVQSLLDQGAVDDFRLSEFGMEDRL